VINGTDNFPQKKKKERTAQHWYICPHLPIRVEISKKPVLEYI
jgi:hypothetical protein